jgi:hypothetical protein
MRVKTMLMKRRTRADMLARTEGLSSELLRLGLYVDPGFSVWERESYLLACRRITQWMCWMLDEETGTKK